MIILGCKAETSSTIDINYSQYPNKPIIDIFINGEGPYPFLLDTAAEVSLISEKLLDETRLNSPDLESKEFAFVNKVDVKKVTDMATVTFADHQTSRKVRFVISEQSYLGPDIFGFLGLDALINSKLINIPEEKRLELTLPNNPYECDILSSSSQCYDLSTKAPTIKSKLGGRDLELKIDTGNTTYKSFLLNKSDLNTKIWKKYRHYSAPTKIDFISDKPVRFLKTRNFIFNGDTSCYADFVIRDPDDSSAYYSEPTALLSWTTVKKAAFEVHFSEDMETHYPKNTCPYGKLNNLGISKFTTTNETEYTFAMLVEGGSPAHRAGIKNGEKIDRIHLENGQIIEHFEGNFFNHPEMHVYAPDGTTLKFDVIRDGKTLQLTAQTHKPFFIDTHKPFVIELDNP